MSTSNDSAPLPVDIISDVVCPWCIIGYKQLQQALDMTPRQFDVDLHWHSFELNPAIPPEGQNLREHLVQKYGTTPDDSQVAGSRLDSLRGFRHLPRRTQLPRIRCTLSGIAEYQRMERE